MEKNLALNKTGEINWNAVFSQLLIFMFLPPVMGLVYAVYRIFKDKNFSKTQYMIFFVCIAAYFAAINATKMPAGDQWRYYAAYMNVPSYGLIKSMIYIYGNTYESGDHISGEFMNGIYNYVGYYITFGYYPLFAFFYTFIEYVLVFVGLYKYCQAFKKPHYPIICGVLILGFFYLYFQYLLQIQKQFFAQSMIMYVLGTYAYEGRMNKKLWTITVIALFTHVSMIMYIPFLYFKKLNQPLNKTSLFWIGAMFIGLIIVGPSLAGAISLDTTTALNYSVQKVAMLQEQDDGMRINMLQVVVIGIPMALITAKKIWFERKTLTANEAFIMNVFFLLLLAVVAMQNQPLAQYRYFMMVFAFMPFVYPFAFNKTSNRDMFLKLLSVVMVVWFYYQFEHIIYDYAPESHILGVPPLFMITNNYLGFDFFG